MSALTENLTAVVALRPHAVARVTNAGLAMLFDRAKGVMYELNESASSVVRLLAQEPRSLQDIIDALCSEFDGPQEEVAADIQTFIEEFATAGLLTVDAP
ncbi:HPr-rel-A system PqqD family peptide chaperone [Nocardia salmonicida]|uniref:HPr-rel-A system PqqD family peptide chaperone n=1 Tax=Nocardia salmonicida TaxID=53431 RepID=UPI0036B1E6C4